MSVTAGVPAFGGHSLGGSVERGATLTAKDSRLDIESETFLVQPTGTLRSTDGGADVDHAMAGHLIAGTLQAAGKAAGSATQQDAESGLLVVHGTMDPDIRYDQAHTLGRNSGQENAVCITGDITHTLKAEGFDASEDGTGRGQPIVAHAIQAGALRLNPKSGPDGIGIQADHAYTLEARAEVQAVQSASAVRRLLPHECERLQGFPDGYTQIPWRKRAAKECPDGPRYKAIGNSKAVPVVRWIGQRIQEQLNAA